MSDVIKAESASLAEMGVTGLEHWSGLLNEEFLRNLQEQQGREVYREMSNNDAVVGAMLFAIEMFLRPVELKAKPFDDSVRAKKDAQFVNEILGDMSHTTADFISEWMAAPTYGFAPFEIVWKRRRGYKRNPDRNSKYSDGRIGISKLAIRHPDSLRKWVFDDKSQVVAMTQAPAPKYEEVTIPMTKMLLFSLLKRKGNPEGTSLLRRAYMAWYRKKRIEEIEAIGIERELAGLPMFTTPAKWWADDASENEKALLDEVKKIARRVRADEQAAIVIPAIFDSDGNQLLTFELVSTGGTRAIETGEPKEYYSQQMAMVIMADVLLMGHQREGSFALSDNKTSLFANGLGAMLDGITDTMNKHLVPTILNVNGRDPSRPPKIVHGDIETPDLDVVGEYVSRLAGAGLPLFPTDKGELERELFRIAGLPESAADEVVARAKKEKEERARMGAEASANGQDRGLAGEGPGFPNQNGGSRPAQAQLDRAT